MNRATVDLCRRRGIEGQGMWSRAEGLWLRFDAGLWDELLDEARELDAWAEAHGDAQIATVARLYRGRVLAHRGDADTTVALASEFMPIARQIEDLQVLAPALVVAVIGHAAAGDTGAAVALAEEFDVATADGPTEYRELYLPEVVRALLGLGEPDLAARIVVDRPVHVRRTRLAVASSHAMLAEARGEPATAAEGFRTAAEGWGGWGGRFEHAHALVGLARSLEALGRADEAADPATRALVIFEAIGVASADAVRE
jgi:hypothetical protein